MEMTTQQENAILTRVGRGAGHGRGLGAVRDDKGRAGVLGTYCAHRHPFDHDLPLGPDTERPRLGYRRRKPIDNHQRVRWAGRSRGHVERATSDTEAGGMFYNRCWFPCVAVLIVAAMLFGCGGGAAKSQLADRGAGDDRAYDRDRIVGIFETAQFFAHSRTYSADDRLDLLVETEPDFDVSELKAQLPGDYEPISRDVFNGVPVGRTSPDVSGSETGTSYARYGGWGNYSYFEAHPDGSMDIPDRETNSDFVVYSIGDATGRNPTQGGATWKGAIIGFDVQPQSVWSITGGATLTVDLEAFRRLEVAAVDIHLHDLRRTHDTKVTYNDLRFNDVPMFDGEFEDELIGVLPVPDQFDNPNTELMARYYVHGSFYGQKHEEVGGIFGITPTGYYREQVIVGAFGGRRAN